MKLNISHTADEINRPEKNNHTQPEEDWQDESKDRKFMGRGSNVRFDLFYT